MLTELVIGLGAFAVPTLFRVSEEILLSTGQMASFGYLFFSALLLALFHPAMVHCMGATFHS
jgi:hypothetical protein